MPLFSCSNPLPPQSGFGDREKSQTERATSHPTPAMHRPPIHHINSSSSSFHPGGKPWDKPSALPLSPVAGSAAEEKKKSPPVSAPVSSFQHFCGHFFLPKRVRDYYCLVAILSRGEFKFVLHISGASPKTVHLTKWALALFCRIFWARRIK